MFERLGCGSGADVGEERGVGSARPVRGGFVFAVLLLLSGFCGISYEILYARILGNLIGDQFVVAASVLLTFLLGIGLGTLYAHRLWRWLWLLEASIGLFGVLAALGTEAVDARLYGVLRWLGPGPGVSMLVCFVLLCPPAFLIGTSLPLFAGYLARLRPGRVFARAYTVYNFGAAVTALLIEFALMRWLGLRASVLVMASLNGAVALGLLLGYGGLRAQPPAPGRAARFPARDLVALALASVGSAVFQLLMVKIAECLVGPFRETFALVLALILLGIAAGSHLVERFRLRFDQVVLAAMVGLAGLLALFPVVARLYATLYPAVAGSHVQAAGFKLGILALLMGLPALAFGSTIPALLTVQRNVARESGRLLFVSSLANAAGFLLMAFVLHRHLDYGVIGLSIAALGGLACGVHRGVAPRRLALPAVLLLAAGWAHATLWQERLLYLGHSSFHNRRELAEAERKLDSLQTFKGYQDVFSITWSDGKPWFFINGYLSIPLTSPAEKLVGAFSSIFAPRTDRALVLGLGSGATAGTVGLLFDRTDAVEINPVVLENLFRMAQWNFDIENRPGVRIIQDDGIHFVRAVDDTYSLIVNTVTTPLYFSSSKLYTRDFLEHVRERLTPDGVYMTWMDARVGSRGADIILRTVGEVFEHCWIGAVKDQYYLLLCSPAEIAPHTPDRIAGQPELARYFFEENGLPPRWIPYGLLSTRASELVRDRDVPVNTLDYPALEFEMARAGHRGIGAFKERLLAALSVDELARALRQVVDWEPVHLTLYTESLLGANRPLARRWRALVREREPDYDRRYRASRLAYYGSLTGPYAATAFARHEHGHALLESRRCEEALVEFRRALDLDPALDNAHYHIGYCQEQLGRLELALESYANERAVDPDDAEAPYREGVVQLKLRRYEPALAALDRALAVRDRAPVHYYRGRALEGLGRTEAARTAYVESLRRAPDNDLARQALLRLN